MWILLVIRNHNVYSIQFTGCVKFSSVLYTIINIPMILHICNIFYCHHLFLSHDSVLRIHLNGLHTLVKKNLEKIGYTGVYKENGVNAEFNKYWIYHLIYIFFMPRFQYKYPLGTCITLVDYYVDIPYNFRVVGVFLTFS